MVTMMRVVQILQRLSQPCDLNSTRIGRPKRRPIRQRLNGHVCGWHRQRLTAVRDERCVNHPEHALTGPPVQSVFKPDGVEDGAVGEFKGSQRLLKRIWICASHFGRCEVIVRATVTFRHESHQLAVATSVTKWIN